jgi:hypothetical protein
MTRLKQAIWNKESVIWKERFKKVVSQEKMDETGARQNTMDEKDVCRKKMDEKSDR